MEKSNMERLSKEVLKQGAESALPCNLPDEWLDLLERDLEMILQEGDHSYLTAPLAIVAHLMFHKNGGNRKEVTFSEGDLYNYLRYLHFEIALETVRRNTNIAPEPATLETILTNRDVEWSK
ncbi:hypothetical protein ICN18_06100 [Polynucleobacter sp. Ross1-W9]|uniref:hypothetical protein n=1 Tax=Polynucleobacter parvulilacunae TaxID=1855631 RepID=UPI001C0B3D3B|nr:hypothetical protein [Polynucleobacter parvulilacunae]MBU3557198.1 hypothetical protein [Polynucleobacter parvulilacunae]